MASRKKARGRILHRQDIVGAAARLFRANGYHGTSMADIGTALGVLGGSLYYYLDSKEELLYDVVETATRGLLTGVYEVSRAPQPAAERLRAAIHNHLRFCVERSDYAVVFLNEIPNLRDVHMRRALLQLVKHYEDVFCRIIEDGVEGGEFRKGLDVKIAVYGILGMGNWALRWFRPDGRMSIEQVAEEFANLVVAGLRP